MAKAVRSARCASPLTRAFSSPLAYRGTDRAETQPATDAAPELRHHILRVSFTVRDPQISHLQCLFTPHTAPFERVPLGEPYPFNEHTVRSSVLAFPRVLSQCRAAAVGWHQGRRTARGGAQAQRAAAVRVPSLPAKTSVAAAVVCLRASDAVAAVRVLIFPGPSVRS